MVDTVELARSPRVPYVEGFVPGSVAAMRGVGAGVDGVRYHRHIGEGAPSIEVAALEFGAYNVALLGPDIPLNDRETIGSRVRDVVIPRTAERAKAHRHDPNIFTERDYTEDTYDTERKLYTTSPQAVIDEFPEVFQFQEDLAPIISKIVGMPVRPSRDPSEATVINWQLFPIDPEDGANTEQEHGAHADRVDITVVACMDNIGPNGSLVVVDGYAEACILLDLDPERNFKGNLNAILNSHLKDSITFRSHHVQKGSVVLLRSTEYHFVTTKSLEDVKTGLRDHPDKDPFFSDEVERELIGRAIVNMAYETEECEQRHQVAQWLAPPEMLMLKGNAFFQALNETVEWYYENILRANPDLSEEDAKRERYEIRHAIVAERSAWNLYGNTGRVPLEIPGVLGRTAARAVLLEA
ncbi:MAG TPA: hypothetical protein VLF40_02435 [Candidatus Saccharimonadales bacterium]|nr:hypothetical protein [Candidatus Saccharimonadales bacterium]